MSNFLSSEQWLEVLGTIAPFVSNTTERTKVIRTFLPDMLDSGYSGTEALGLFQQSSMGIRSADFFAIRRTILDDTNLTSALRNLSLNETISENSLRVSSRIMEQKYGFLAAYAIEDSSTGDVRYGEWMFYTNQLGEKGDILNQILEDIKSRYPLGNFDTLTANLRKGYIDLGK